MYLHLGNDIVIKDSDVIGIFDLDKTTVFKVNRNYLSNAQKKGKIVNVTEKLPKSFVICSESSEERVYLSQLMSSTLFKRDVALSEFN